jgi:iron uptake system component EfeO
MEQTRMRRLAAGAAGVVVVLAACSSSDGKAATRVTIWPSTLNVKLVAGGCGEPTYAARAGSITFVARNTTARDAEFEILAPGPTIVAEKDPIEAGKTATLTESLTAGDYELRCALGSDAKTSTLTVTGKGGGAVLKVDQAALDAAVARYKTFVLEQTDILQQKTREFANAVESGKVEQAKALYAPGRVPWETIEPVAELFPDADAAIDSRVDDHEGPDDPKWTGWHRIEKGLWQDNSTEGLTPFAHQLATDTGSLVTQVKALTIDPGVMTNGAAALIEEAAQGKITGEEERYSHTDLITFTANVDGAKKIVELLTPVLSTAPGGTELLTEINERFAKVDAILAPYRQGDTYVSYEQVSDATRDQLKAAMADLSEELAEISGTLGLKVQ